MANNTVPEPGISITLDILGKISIVAGLSLCAYAALDGNSIALGMGTVLSGVLLSALASALHKLHAIEVHLRPPPAAIERDPVSVPRFISR